MKTLINAPNIEVRFTSVSGDKFVCKSANLGGDIINVSTKKTFDQPVGTFSITMIARKDFFDFYSEQSYGSRLNSQSVYEIFKPSGLVDIYINGKEQMLGMIDNIRRSFTMGDGKGRRIFTITGRDMGALLVEHKVWWDDSIGGLQRNRSSVNGPTYIFGNIYGSPVDIIRKIIYNWFYKVVNNEDNHTPFKYSDGDLMQDKFIAMPESVTGEDLELPIIIEKLQYVYDAKLKRDVYKSVSQKNVGTIKGPGALSHATYGNYFPLNFSAWNYQGDLYTFIKKFASNPFNELWLDTGGNDVVVGNIRENGETTDKIKAVGPDGKITDKTIGEGIRLMRMDEGKAYLILRPSPFDDQQFGLDPFEMPSLLTIQDLNNWHKNYVTDVQIVSKDLGFGRNGRPSVYFVNPVGALALASQSRWIVPPEYDDEANTRYGYNPMEVSLDFFNLFTDSFKMTSSQNVCSILQKKLKKWYGIMDKMLNGTMTIMGNENLRIGQSISYVRDETEKIEEEYEEGYYYITSVEQIYDYPNKFITNLSLERGISNKIIDEIRNGKKQ